MHHVLVKTVVALTCESDPVSLCVMCNKFRTVCVGCVPLRICACLGVSLYEVVRYVFSLFVNLLWLSI
jgi:hypothetical protein